MAQPRKTSQKLTNSQAARALGVSDQYVRWLAVHGRLEFEQTPLGRLFPADAVERMRRERAAA